VIGGEAVAWVGLEDPEALDGLVGQICYRAADLGFLLGQEGHRLEQYSRHLRRAKGDEVSMGGVAEGPGERGRGGDGSGRTGVGGVAGCEADVAAEVDLVMPLGPEPVTGSGA
jgi:hypothetical protein